MSSFNWFSRRYDDSDDSDDLSKETPDTTPDGDDSSDQASDQPTSAEDYLKWAKAAYQNIQQQQAETAEEEEETEEAGEVEEAEASGQDAETESSSEPPKPVTAETPDPVTEPEPEPEPDIADSSEPEISTPDDEAAAHQQETPSKPSPSLETEVATEATTEASAPVPFWMQAQEEREERLERLKETAIVEPEPEPESDSREETEELILPDIDFDEAFVWSAEVLASQGRRPDQISAEEITWLKRLRQGLTKTRLGLVNQLKSIVGQGPLNDEAVFEIEALLLQADVGVDATDYIINALQTRLKEEALPPDQAIRYLKSLLRNMLDAPLEDTHNLLFVPESDVLNIWFMTGVNGAGKTTTIGKLGHIAKKSGYKCLIAAADTFRAAAVEQVKVWGQRSDIEVISNPGQNTDPAAVVFDAITSAKSRETELLLIDTAGRLQNKKNLMDELAKMRRIIDKKAPEAKIESLLVLDSTLGQNGIRQAKVFSEAANLSGVVLTKLDGTAKGGVALAVVQQLGLPIRFIGAGEGIEDLRPFSSYEFVEALLSD